MYLFPHMAMLPCHITTQQPGFPSGLSVRCPVPQSNLARALCTIVTLVSVFLPLPPSRSTHTLSQLPRHLNMVLHSPAIVPMACSCPGRYIDDDVGTCIAPW